MSDPARMPVRGEDEPAKVIVAPRRDTLP